MTKKDKLLEKIDSVFKQTQVVIDGIATNSRIQLKEMAEAVSIALGIDPKSIAHYVSDYAHNCDEGYVSRGKKGGFIKGVKSLKAPKSVVVDSSPIIDSSDDTSDEDTV